MNKIVDTLIVAAMLMTSVPSLSETPVLIAPHQQDAPAEEVPQSDKADTANMNHEHLK